MMRLERRASLLVALFLLTSRDGLRRVRVGVLARSERSAKPRKFVTAGVGMEYERSLRAGADPKAGV